MSSLQGSLIVKRIIKCVSCGKGFSTDRVSRKYCERCIVSSVSLISARICPTCSKEFKPKRKNVMYCGKDCRPSAGEKIVAGYCINCGAEFKTRNGRRTCSETCLAARRLQVAEMNSKRMLEKLAKPRMYYVYGWINTKISSLPFYIGKGCGNRAWEVHYEENIQWRRKSFCEDFRVSGHEVVIYRDNLTEEGALLVESVLVTVFRGLGAHLTNVCNTMMRQEIPPLLFDPIENFIGSP